MTTRQAAHVSDRLMLANQNQDLEELREADDIGLSHTGVSDMDIERFVGFFIPFKMFMFG